MSISFLTIRPTNEGLYNVIQKTFPSIKKDEVTFVSIEKIIHKTSKKKKQLKKLLKT
jgi:hypothetical protein